VSELVDSSLVSQAYNPELAVDPRKSHSVIDRQILQLRLITTELRKAYGGFYVDWIDIKGLSLLVTLCAANTFIRCLLYKALEVGLVAAFASEYCNYCCTLVKTVIKYSLLLLFFGGGFNFQISNSFCLLVLT